jgi:very-short-patch-repair endonuclease
MINPKKLELARHFRKNPTESEDAVWQMLRNRQIKNLKWRRQQVLAGFIADFYCAELNVVLEIDGSVHDNEEVKEYDEFRTSVFASKGIKVFRLKNENCDKQHLTELIENIITSLR